MCYAYMLHACMDIGSDLLGIPLYKDLSIRLVTNLLIIIVIYYYFNRMFDCSIRVSYLFSAILIFSL